ncbi:hypothetical protein GGS26DRAFT_595269 [Hypomontagnella submonticulosa]|nr:hypothetical protein GGS26DRAFT_595269 [Hypomontagnella submonticulosa]
MASQEASQGAVNPPDTCHEHGRSICPSCLFNCEVEDSAAPCKLEENTQMYIAYPPGPLFSWLFSWSSFRDDDNDQKLETIHHNPYAHESNTIAQNAGWHPLFVPQFDEQAKGIEIRQRFVPVFLWVRLKAPVPEMPGTAFSQKPCNICQLRWLRGHTRDEEHPHHNSLLPADTKNMNVKQRSLVVCVDGQMPAGSQAGAQTGSLTVGLGVFFSTGSKYNQSQPLRLASATKQSAEFHAARLALTILKERVIPDWREHLKQKDNKPSDETDNKTGNKTDDKTDDKTKGKTENMQDDTSIRLIIATDSKAMVETFTTNIKKWQYDAEKGTYYRASGTKRAHTRVKNSDIIRDIQVQIDELEGVEVVWYPLSREYNDEARNIASAARHTVADGDSARMEAPTMED